jgi:hypothetical protein
MRLAPLQAALVLLGASAARADAPPWWFESHAAGGLDSNVLRDRSALKQSPLLRVDGEAGLHWPRGVHLVAGGYLEQNLEISALSEAELEAQLGARQPLGSRLTLVIGSLTAYRRELSVFSDGLLLTTGAILRNEIAEDAVALLELDLGPVDLEAGTRGDVKSTSGNEDYLLLGAGVLASARAGCPCRRWPCGPATPSPIDRSTASRSATRWAAPPASTAPSTSPCTRPG